MTVQYRYAILSFKTRVQDDSGVWREETINTAGYEIVDFDYNPDFLVLFYDKDDQKGLAILRSCITKITLLEE